MKIEDMLQAALATSSAEVEIGILERGHINPETGDDVLDYAPQLQTGWITPGMRGFLGIGLDTSRDAVKALAASVIRDGLPVQKAADIAGEIVAAQIKDVIDHSRAYGIAPHSQKWAEEKGFQHPHLWTGAMRDAIAWRRK